MAQVWERLAPGIRARRHPTRKHGNKHDRYFVIRYATAGQKRQEALGWSSEGWTLQRAQAELYRLKEAARTGEGPRTMAERREKAEEMRLAEESAKAAAALEAFTFRQFCADTYMPQAEEDKKPNSVRTEKVLLESWILPTIGSKPLKAVTAFDLERLKKSMADAGRAPRTITYALAVVRQVLRHAHRLGLVDADLPTSKVKKPASDNRRMRFLTNEEADKLLDMLAEKSPDLRDMALLSLHCGLRAGEIFSLTWADVDLGRGILALRDTKSGRNRCAILTSKARAILEARGTGQPSVLVFPGRNGKPVTSVSRTFDRVVEALGFNADVTDPRQKFVFHSLRHTYASWLVERGVDLYTVKELLGHSCISMTQRYAHLAPDTLRRAVQTFEAGMKPTRVKRLRQEG